MANETPKKPIKRNTVPTVSKDSTMLPAVKSESKTTQIVMLLVLFLVVSGIVYLAIFQRPLLSKYLASKPTTKSEIAVSDTTSQQFSDSTGGEDNDELNTFIGQDKPSKKNAKVYPAGSNYYLVAGTFIFYPYAEKCRDKMKAQGYDADIISTGDSYKFHRVYIQSSTDGAAVRAKRDELRSAGNTEVWVYVE